MITGGISFQPGLADPQKKIDPANANGSQEGVQEAIKVLSLRLPKVVGAQAAAPNQLLTAPGAGGNSRVDSMVEAVMQKYFPTNTPQQAMAPGAPQMPMVHEAPSQRSPQPEAPQQNFWNNFPRIIIGNPPEAPMTGGPPREGQATWDGGYNPIQFGMTEPAPQLPDLRKQLDWIPAPNIGNDQPLI